MLIIILVIVLLTLAILAFLLKRQGIDLWPTANSKKKPDPHPRYKPEDVERRESFNHIDQVQSTTVCDDIETDLLYRVGCAQWIGEREDQEDACAVSDWQNADTVARQGILAAVADGIGGLDDGQIASTNLIQSLMRDFKQLEGDISAQGKLLELTARGHQSVLNINRHGKRCGTTLVATLIQDKFLSFISVGDSRIALYRSGVLLQLNREHINARVKDESTALDGTAPVEGRRRVALTSYIGKEGLSELDRNLNPIQLISGDRVLLMSDGVFGTLNDDQLVALLEQDAQQAANAIIEHVREQGLQYQDNATAVVVEVL